MTAGCDYCSHTGVQADGETPCPCQEIPIAKADLAAVEHRLRILENRLDDALVLASVFLSMIVGTIIIAGVEVLSK